MKFDFSQLLGQNTAIILENPINIRYLTNCPIDDGFMIICEQGKFLLVDDRYLLDAKIQDDTQVVRLTSFNKQLPKLIEKFHVKRVLLEEKYVTLSRYNNYLNILPKVNVDLTSSVSNYFLNMRAKKMPDEIKKIKEAQRLADEAFAYIVDYVKPGVTEKEIAVKLEQKLLKLGSEGRAFDFIVVSGERTAIPHGKPTEREIKDGDFVTIDFGAKVDGYSSDMTRTLAIGKIDDEKREVYNIVLNAQKKAIDNIKPGITGGKIDEIAREYITEYGYGKFFTHSLGHGVGLDIHELPRLFKGSNDVLQVGSIVTVEPGIYIPGKFGIRIEDMILITENKIENLTGFTKDI